MQKPLTASIKDLYKIVEVHQQGSMRQSFVATDKADGGIAVLKMTKIDQDFDRAHAICDQLQSIPDSLHAKIIRCQVTDSHLEIAREHIPGRSIAEILDEKKKSDLISSLEICAKLFEAIAQFHRTDLLHNNLKPSNVLMRRQNNNESLVLCDPLISIDRLGYSFSALNLGDLRYISPERAGLIKAEIGPASDIYSAGLICFELLTGKALCNERELEKIFRQHLETYPSEATADCEETFPKVLETILDKLCAKDPNERYQSATAAAADFTDLATKLDAGEDEPQLVVGLRDRRRALAKPAFVGRVSELMRLNNLIETSPGGTIVIEAPSGIGKTRLANEFLRDQQRAGALTFSARASDEAVKEPLHPLRQIVGEIVKHALTDPSIRMEFQRCWDAYHEELVAVFPRLRAIFGDSAPHDGSGEELDPPKVLKAVSQFFSCLQRMQRTTIIFLDDIGDADPLTIQSVIYWYRNQSKNSRNSSLYLLLASRPVLVLKEIAQAALPLEHLSLRPVSRAELSKILESMAGPLPSHATNVVHELADGNIFVATSILQGMIEAGALVSSGEGWTVNDDKLTLVQSSNESTRHVVSRLSTIQPATRELLETAAVIGRTFSVNSVFRAMTLNSGDVVDCITEAKQKHFIWEIESAAVYQFVHDQIRTALLAHMSDKRKKNIHKQIAQYLMKYERNKCLEISHHLDSAGLHEEAYPFALESYGIMKSRQAPQQAMTHLLIAEKGVPSQDKAMKAEIAENLAQLYIVQGDYHGAEAKFGEALTYLSNTRDRARIKIEQAEILFRTGEIQRAEQCSVEANKLLGIQRQASPLAAFELIWRLVTMIFRRKEPVEEARLCRKAYKIALKLAIESRRKISASCYYLLIYYHERKGEGEASSDLYRTQAILLKEMGLVDQAVSRASAACHIAHQNSALDHARSLYLYSRMCMYQGNLPQSIQSIRESVELFEKTNCRYEAIRSKIHLAACYYSAGNLDKAQSLYKDTIAEASKRSDLAIQAVAALGLAWCGQIDRKLVSSRLTGSGHGLVQVCSKLITALECYAEFDYTGAHQIIKDVETPRGRRFDEIQCMTAIFKVQNLREWIESLPSWSAEKRADLLSEAEQAIKAAHTHTQKMPLFLPALLREEGRIQASLGESELASNLLLQSRDHANANKQTQDSKLAEQFLSEISDSLDPKLIAEQDIDTTSFETTYPQQHQHNPYLSLVARFENTLTFGQRITTSHSLVDILTQMEEAASSLLRAQYCSLYEVSYDDEQVNLILLRGTHDIGLKPDFIHFQKNHQSRTDIEIDLKEAIYEHERIKSFLFVPVSVRGRIEFVICLSHFELENHFRTEEKKIADYISHLGAAAIENMRGFESVRDLSQSLRRDILKRRATEADLKSTVGALKESEERFRSLVDGAADGFFVHDDKGVIYDVNERACEMLAKDRSTLVGSNLLELATFADENEVLISWELAAQGSNRRIEGFFRGLKKSRPIAVEMSVTSYQQEPTRLLTLARDISARINAERHNEGLQQKLNHASKLATLGTLSTSIAHELNNPLTNVRGFAQLIERDQKSPDEVKNWSNKIITAANRMRSIVDHLRAFGRDDNEDSKSALSVNVAVSQARELIFRQLEARGISCTLELEDRINPISGNLTQLESVVQNLLANSRDAFDDLKKEVVKEISITTTQDGGLVRLTYTDNAGGMPKAVLDRIFDPFFTTKSKGVGSGLGLSIIKGIIDDHGASIDVQSEFGEGTKIVIDFPALEITETQEVEADNMLTKIDPKVTEGGRKRRCMVVDDDTDTLTFLENALSSHFEVSSYAEPLLALERLSASSFDIVLADFHMPQMDGLELLLKMKKACPTIDYILFSADRDINVESALLNGASGFIEKPFNDSEELIQQIEGLLVHKAAS